VSEGTPADDPVGVLHRWEERGAVWRVLGRTPTGLEVSLLTCDGGEEVERLVSDDPALAEYVAGGPRSG
jgi:hypothetical protein